MPSKGLYANIHAKRKRIKAGSGEKMKKAGAKEHRKQLMAKHDQLLDCIRELRATTHKYREEV